MRKGKILACILSISLLGGLCACADKDNSSSQQNKSNGRTVVKWWAFPTFSQENPADAAGTYEKKLINAFETVHPDIDIQLSSIDFTTGPDKISMGISNGNVCDVLFDAPGRIISYGKNGKLVSLEDMFTDDFVSDVNNDELIKACKSGDTPYMYPLSSAPFYMAFNKAYLEDAGVLELVKEGWTTDDFTKVITALNKSGYIPGSVFCNNQGGDQGTRAFFANLFSSHITNSDLTAYTINDEGGKKAFSYVNDAVSKGLLISATDKDGTAAISSFVRGDASFSLLWGSAQQKSNQTELDKNGIETVEVPYPSDDGQAELEYLVNGFCVFDNGDEDVIYAAKEFIAFACDNDKWGKSNVVQTGCIPVRTSFGDLYDDERMSAISSWSSMYSTYYNTISGFADMRTLWYQSLQDMLNANITPESCADRFVSEADKTISK